MNTVGIVMATYNGMKYVEDQIESILSNTYTDWRLYIYDDGSKDQTVSILKRYEEKYPEKIQVTINQENLGVTFNFLEGIKQCENEYIMLCDQDDVWKQDKIEKTLNKMIQAEKNHDKGHPIIVYTDAAIVDEELHMIHPSFHKNSRLDVSKVDLPHLLMENKLIGCTIMLNKGIRNLLTKLPRSPRVHDWWLGLLATTFGKIYYLEEPTLLYRQHRDNVIGNERFISYVKGRIYNMNKQRENLNSIQIQGQEFYIMYKKQLSPENEKILHEFSHLFKESWFKRRYLLLKGGYTKSGIIRNIGVFLLV